MGPRAGPTERMRSSACVDRASAAERAIRWVWKRNKQGSAGPTERMRSSACVASAAARAIRCRMKQAYVVS